MIALSGYSLASSKCEQVPEREKQFFDVNEDLDAKSLSLQYSYQLELRKSVLCHELEAIEKYKDETQEKLEDVNARLNVETDPIAVKDLTIEKGYLEKLLPIIEEPKDALIHELQTYCSVKKSDGKTNTIKDPKSCNSTLAKSLGAEIDYRKVNNQDKMVIFAENDLKKLTHFIAKKANSSVLKELPDLRKMILGKLDSQDIPIGGNERILLDLLLARSDEISLHKLKTLALNQNITKVLNVLRHKVAAEESTKAAEKAVKEAAKNATAKYKDSRTKNKFSKTAEDLAESKIRGMENILGISAYDIQSLAARNNKLLELSFDDSWLQNSNLENRLSYVDEVVREYGTKIIEGKSSPADEKIFVDHTKKYLSRLTSSSRYNIGLGGALVQTPSISFRDSLKVDLSGIDVNATGTTDRTLYSTTISEDTFFGVYFDAKTPYFDLNLIVPNYEAEVVEQFPVFLRDPDLDGLGYYTKSTAEIRQTVSFDALLLFNYTQVAELFMLDRFGEAPQIFGDFVDIGFGVGITSMDFDQNFTTLVREKTEVEQTFDSIPGGTTISSNKSYSKLLNYFAISLGVDVGDQFEAGIQFRRYRSSDSRFDGLQLDIDGETTVSVNLKYIFF